MSPSKNSKIWIIFQLELKRRNPLKFYFQNRCRHNFWFKVIIQNLNISWLTKIICTVCTIEELTIHLLKLKSCLNNSTDYYTFWGLWYKIITHIIIQSESLIYTYIQTMGFCGQKKHFIIYHFSDKAWKEKYSLLSFRNGLFLHWNFDNRNVFKYKKRHLQKYAYVLNNK